MKSFNQKNIKITNPLKKNQKRTIYLILFGILLNSYTTYSQTNNEISVYNWFDSKIGVESLDFENGPAHLNFDKTIDNHNRYYVSEDFKKGSFQYNNQDYFDLLLNYDVYNDELILKPYGESNTTKVNIIKDNVSYFKIGNEKFVNLKIINTPTFRKGYYEEVLLGNSLILYIKYYKEKKRNNKDENDLIEFVPKYEFLILKDNKLYPVNTKKQIVELFPNNKRKINDYYDMNSRLKKDDTAVFMKNLLKYINN